MFVMYRNPEETGWLGWFEDADGDVIAFVGLDRKVVFAWELSFRKKKGEPVPEPE